MALLAVGCSHFGGMPTQTGAEVRLSQEESAKLSKIAAAIEAASFANSQNPDGFPKSATNNMLKLGRSWAGAPIEADRIEFMKLVNLELAGKLTEAKDGYEKAMAEVDAKNREIERLKVQIAAEREKAKAEIQAKLDEANSAAEAMRDRIITYIMFGSGAFLLFAGVVMLVLAGKFGAIYPFLGPRAAFAAIAAGLVLVATGIAVNAIERALEQHPWILYAGAGASLLCVAVAGALIYANHHHVTNQA